MIVAEKLNAMHLWVQKGFSRYFMLKLLPIFIVTTPGNAVVKLSQPGDEDINRLHGLVAGFN